MSVEDGKAHVVVIDALKLRRAGILRLVEDWAAANNLEITAVAPWGFPTEFEVAPNCRMVMLNIGGCSVRSPDIASCIEAVASLMPDAPLVVISDVDTPTEIVSAFRAGACGYIPTATEPTVALTTLTFILRGGSYFPPAALLSTATPCTECETSGGPNHRDENSGTQARSLTMRQQEVIRLLREGMPNKLIARHLRMTEATVKVHVRQIMRKLGANNRTQAALCAAKVQSAVVQQKHVVSLAPAPTAAA